MNNTERFIRHVIDVTNHSGVYTRKLLNTPYWVVIRWNELLFLSTTDMVMPEDEVMKTGTHMQCVEFLTRQYTEV